MASHKCGTHEYFMDKVLSLMPELIACYTVFTLEEGSKPNGDIEASSTPTRTNMAEVEERQWQVSMWPKTVA